MTFEVRLTPLVAPSRQLTAPRVRAARMRSLRPLVATAAMLVVVVGSVGSLLRAGIQPQGGSSSLNFSSQFAQQQFASVEHQRIEQHAIPVTLPLDTAHQRFERLQMTIGSNS